LRINRKKSLLKIIIFLISLGCIPFSVSLLLNVPSLFTNYTTFTHEMLWMSIGFLVFLLFFFLFGAPVKSYILEHELSHVLFALMSGVKVKDVSLKSDRAWVKTERVTIFIALAPYSLPLYTLILIILYKLISIIYKNRVLLIIVYFLLGISLSFHIVATIHYIQLDQPDMKRYGYFSSLVLIFTWSLIILALLCALIFDEIELVNYFRISLSNALDMYSMILHVFTSMVNRF